MTNHTHEMTPEAAPEATPEVTSEMAPEAVSMDAVEDREATVDIAIDAGERRLRRILMIVGGLWLALVPVMMMAFPGIAFFHYAWLSLLIANLTVWPVVLIAGAVTEVRKGLRDARTALALHKAERAIDAPADPRLALD